MRYLQGMDEMEFTEAESNMLGALRARVPSLMNSRRLTLSFRTAQT